MSVNKGLIAGIVVVGLGLCVGLGWWLARTHDRRDAELAAAERKVIEEAIAKAAEVNRKALEEARANDAKEKAASDARKQQYDAQYTEDHKRLAEAQAQMAALEALPRQRALLYMQKGEWKKLDDLVDSLAASGERAPNGRFQLQLVTFGIEDLLNHMEQSGHSLQANVEAYQRERPESAFAPLLPVMHLHSAAWRARGSGYSHEVTAEGWKLFRDRNQQAWLKILAARSRSDRLPTWYHKAISVGMDAGIEGKQLRGLFDEGIARFPGYHMIYFVFLRQYSPRWGGSYTEADAFIREQVAAPTNPEGEMLYTQLYWNLDNQSGNQLDFFQASRVDWPRMRTGLEAWLQKYPDNVDRARFAALACRARDGSTYMKLRKQVSRQEFTDIAPEGVSLDICDARFLVET